MFIAALFTVAKTGKQYMEYYSAIKNEILPFTTIWLIELKGIILVETSNK